MTPCFCGRAPRGFAFQEPHDGPFGSHPITHCCSMHCLDITYRSHPVKPEVNESEAVSRASGEVGAYLDTIGKTDLATMSEHEWNGFLLHAFKTIANQVRDICDEQVPF